MFVWRPGDDSAVCLKEGARSLCVDDDGLSASSERWLILDLEDEDEEDEDSDSVKMENINIYIYIYIMYELQPKKHIHFWKLSWDLEKDDVLFKKECLYT